MSVGSEKEGYDKIEIVINDPALVNWLTEHGATAMSEFILEKGLGERLDVYIERPATVTLIFYAPTNRLNYYIEL